MSTIDALRSIWDGFDFSYLLSIILGLVPALLCVTLHEFSHGYAAYKLGDDTAKRTGRLTLNPLRSLDPLGLVMLLMFHFGWAKPVPVNMFRFKNPKRGMALTALAGPMCNLVLAVVFMFFYGLAFIPLGRSAVGGYFLEMIQITAVISLGYTVFNLIPISPLDGSKVLYAFMRDEAYYKLMRYEKYGSIVLFALVATGVLGRPLSTAVNWLYARLVPVAQAGCDLVYYLFYK